MLNQGHSQGGNGFNWKLIKLELGYAPIGHQVNMLIETGNVCKLNNQQSTIKLNFVCHECGKGLINKNNLEVHMC